MVFHFPKRAASHSNIFPCDQNGAHLNKMLINCGVCGEVTVHSTKKFLFSMKSEFKTIVVLILAASSTVQQYHI